MLTIRADIKKTEKKRDGTYNVKIRFTLDRKMKRVPTSFFVTSDDLTPSFAIKKRSKVYPLIEGLLAKYRSKYNKLDLDNSKLPLSEIVAIVTDEKKKEEKKKEAPIDFIAFSRAWINSTSIKGAKNYQSALNSFLAFLGKKKLPIKSFTAVILKQYLEYLKEQNKARDKKLLKEGKRLPSCRRVSLYMGSLRHLYNEAQLQYNDYENQNIRIEHSPFNYIKIPKPEVTRKRAITVEQLLSLYNLPDSKYPRYNIARDCFILSFLLMGINSIDLFNANCLQENTLKYCRAKTKDRRSDKAYIEVKIPQIARSIVKKYRDRKRARVFNFHRLYSTSSNFNKAINIGLKLIGEDLGIEDLEYYAARHTWATLAVNKVGIDKYTVHSALNHLDSSMEVTDIYIAKTFEMENKANQRVIDYVFGEGSY